MKPGVPNASQELDSFWLVESNKTNRNTKEQTPMQPSTIGAINNLPEPEKRAIYARYNPKELIEKFHLADLNQNEELLKFRFAPGSSDVEMMV